MFRKILKRIICFFKKFVYSSNNDEILIFKSGFNDNVAIKYLDNSESSDAVLTGKDRTLSNSFNWNMITNCNLGSHKLQFIGGNNEKRTVSIVDNPDTNYNNKALLFSISDHWEDSYGNGFSRIQLPIYDNPRGIHEMYIKQRMRLGNDFNIMRELPTDITNVWGAIICELFNDEAWTSSPYKFRLKVTIKKNPDNTDLIFLTDGQTHEDGRHNTVWDDINYDFKILTDKWIEIEYYLKNGNKDIGRFIMTAKYDDSPTKHTIFDIHDSVHHPNDPDPYGIRHIQLLKLYNSTNLTEFFKQNGKKMEIYWDHLELWKNKKINFNND